MQPVNFVLRAAVAAALFTTSAGVRADVITDWNQRASDIVVEAKLGTPPAIRVMALVQTAAHEAAVAAQDGSVDAAVASANRAILAKLLPAQQASIDKAYATAIGAIADGPAKADGIAHGEKAAAAVLARRAGDMAAAGDEYRPHAGAGIYVPTAAPAGTTWGKRKPWLVADVAQVRPAAPPALSSDAWARDYNEVKALGAKSSSTRNAEQTDIARFWEYSLPPIYYGVLKSVADAAGRDVLRNARLYAAASQAMDDAMISVFDAKYHYHFWRPVTAIRNGDGDGNAATDRDASWTPLVDAPMHPEFPSGHAILAGSVGAVIKADIGRGAMPMLTTTSPSAKGAARKWSSPEEFVREVSLSRIYAGIHYRSAVEAGAATGQRIGELAASSLIEPQARMATR